MAKTGARVPDHARPLGHFRLRFVEYTRRDGTRIVRSYPRKRPGEPAPIVKAWQEDLPFTRRAIASMSQCTTRFIEPWLPRSGYTMWDWLNAMFHGKGMRHTSPHQYPKQPPLLFREPPNPKWEGAPRILTPTVKVKKTTVTHGIYGSWVWLTPNSELWDTNDFWRSTPNPERLTIRAKGLYLVSHNSHGYSGGAITMATRIMLNGTTQLEIRHDTGDGDAQATPGGSFFWYFNAGDYITIEAACKPTGDYYYLDDFSITAITPETIF